MDLQRLMPGLGANGLVGLLLEGRWQILHGGIGRFPEFLQPDDGALSSIGKLATWPRFEVASRDDAGRYHQVKGTGKSALAYYNDGALINSRSIEEVTESANAWLGDWAETLAVSRAALRLNSWAVRGTGGIDWHFDPEDVIHFQIKGDKLLKLLRTHNTHFADGQMKRFERIMKKPQAFADASEEIVGAGTITIIPRGVWHWSEGKSDESFAVSLCVNPPSSAQLLSRTLSKRLRLIERYRMPLLGPTGSQREAVEACARQADALLKAMNWKSVLSEECQLEVSPDHINEYYFYIGHRANARLDPTRIYVDGRELTIQGNAEERAVVEAACTIGDGFRARDLQSALPHVAVGTVNEVLTTLTGIGFLDFVDTELDI